MPQSLSHIDSDGNLKMVDVKEKAISFREARGQATVTFPSSVFEAIVQAKGVLKKGSIFEVSRIAGIMAAKNTANVIPLCHPIALEGCDLDFLMDSKTASITIHSRVSLHGKTGVEMEALNAVSAAALCLYDMCKALSHEIVIDNIHLVAKSGGKKDFSRR